MSQPSSLPEWISWGVTQEYIHDAIVFNSLADVSGRFALYGQTLLTDYGLRVPFAAGLGLLALTRRSRARLAFILVSYVLLGGMAANYRGNARPFIYYLPSFVVLIYAYGEGLNVVWQAARRLKRSYPWRLTLQALCAGLALAVPLLQFRQAYPSFARKLSMGSRSTSGGRI